MRIPIIGIILVYLIGIAIDIYIYRDIKRSCKSKRSRLYKFLYIATSVLMFAYVTFAFMVPRKSAQLSIVPLMWMFYSYGTIYISKLLYLICSAIGKLFSRKPGSHNHGIPVGACIGAMVFCIMWWGSLVTRNQINVESVVIESERLPEEFDGLRILQFSDTHVGTWGNDTTFVSQLVDSINAQNADLILFTGDIVTRQTAELAPFIRTFSRLHAKYGVYSVLGNHDYGDYMHWDNEGEHEANNAILATWESQMGWELLNNDYRYLHIGTDSIALIGVENWGEPPFRQAGNLKSSYPNTAESNLNDSTFKILMTHNPVHWDREVTTLSNIDLSLAGHTHAMQTMIKIGNWKWSPAKWRYSRWGGLYKSEDKPMYLYVNIGVGEVGFPARFIAAYPELTVFTLKRKR